ncbi:MAG: imidazoleglycerol-phosphate dehydratase, partial [Planctomycetia bacterium]
AAFVWKVKTPSPKIGTFDAELAAEFWNAVAGNARMNFHALLHYGANSHHIVEAVFKSAAKSLRQATTIDPGAAGRVPSTKGSLS